MAGEFAVEGLADLNKALGEFADKFARNAVRGGVRAGAKIQAAAAKSAVHSVSGDLAKSIKVSTRVKGGLIIGQVKAGNAAAYYAHMVEFGTASHVISAKPGHALAIGGGTYSKVTHPGAKKRPFMRVALDQTANAALEAFKAYVSDRIDKQRIEQADPGDAK